MTTLARRVTTRAVLALLALVSTSCSHAPARAATALTTVRVASGLSNPVWVTSPPGDPRLFIVEKIEPDLHGYIKILKNGNLLPTPFLVTPSTLPTYTEQGLLGLAFAPDYATSRRFYIYYTDLDNSCVLERRHASASNPDVADTTREELLRIYHWNLNHNGGWLAFGPDGKLYLSIGDGGGGGDPGNRAQSPDSLLGKILRLDVSGASGYVAPPDNPFAGATTGRQLVWAYGLRNPWRDSFDRATGDLVIGDVGQMLHEEIDFAPASAGTGKGVNFGWPCWEGEFPYDLSRPTPCTTCADTACMQMPAFTYGHNNGECAVTGGYVYRGSAIPDLVGTYFFADYCYAHIWSGKFVGGKLTGIVDRTAELAPQGGQALQWISSFGEDKDGELYICDVNDGEVFKIAPASSAGVGNPPPGGGHLISLAGAMPFKGSLALAVTPDVAEQVRVSIEDVTGRHVRTLVDAVLPAGRQAVTWDGLDDAGRQAPPGVYLVRAVTPHGQETVRAVRVR
jgi:glucose/arabinose dehydrogenase